MDLADKNSYKLLDPVLEEIGKKLALDKLSKREFVDAHREFFDEFRKKLYQTDPILTLYKGTKFSGSYANNVRIRKADEFDMMICMKLEIPTSILNSPYPGYVQLKTEGLDALRQKPNWNKYKSMEKWLDSKQFLLQNKFREWFESVINKTFNSLQQSANGQPLLSCGHNQYRLRMKKANPAFTITVEKVSNEGIKFDVDLVPNFIFQEPEWPPIVKKKKVVKYSSKEWFVIAKPINDGNDIRHKCWRMVLPLQEYELLQSKNSMKQIIRLLKQLRDKHEMPYIKSYFINTLFLWECDNQPIDFWKNRLSFLFLHMLQQLRKYINSGEIPFFWDNRLNLLEKLSSNQLQGAVKRIDGILRRIQKNYPSDPCILKDILLDTATTCYNLVDQEPPPPPDYNTALGILGAVAALAGALWMRNRNQQ